MAVAALTKRRRRFRPWVLWSTAMAVSDDIGSEHVSRIDLDPIGDTAWRGWEKAFWRGW
jgi:hypothetical protein